MRIALFVLASLLLLAACGNEEEIAAKKAELKLTRAQLSSLKVELEEKSKGWQEVKDAFIDASQTLRRALLGDDEAASAAAQEAYYRAQTKDQEVKGLERDLNRRIRDLEAKEKDLVAAIKKLGGGNTEP